MCIDKLDDPNFDAEKAVNNAYNKIKKKNQREFNVDDKTPLQLNNEADNKTPFPLNGSATIHSSGGQGVSNVINTIGDINLGGLSTSTSSITTDMYYGKTLVNARVTAETVELLYIKRAKFTYTMNSFGYQQYNSDLAIKEIYGCQDGKLTLLKTVNGRVNPPYQVEERLVFDDEIEDDGDE